MACAKQGCRRARRRRIEPNLPAVSEGLRKAGLPGVNQPERSLRERVRCSLLVDWPVYPRLIRTLWASTPSHNPRHAAPSQHRATTSRAAEEAARQGASPFAGLEGLACT
jgi:hypothetical protein